MSSNLMKLDSLLYFSDMSNTWKFQVVIMYTLRNITHCLKFFHFCIFLGFMSLKLHQKLAKDKNFDNLLEPFKVLSWNFNWVFHIWPWWNENKMSKFIIPFEIKGSSINISSFTTYNFCDKVVNMLVPFWKLEKSFSV